MGKTGQRINLKRGFTTVEFMGAVLIGGILSVIAIAGFRLYEREMPVNYAAEKLSRTMATARAYAVANNSVFTLQLDTRYQTYWIDETNEIGAILVPKVTTPEKVGAPVTLTGVTFGLNPTPTELAPAPIRFYPDGSCDDARVMLKMTGERGEIYYWVRAYGPTGQSRVLSNVTTATLSMTNPTGKTTTTP